MLDDLKYIHERDREDALGIAAKEWAQLDYKYEFNVDIKTVIQNVIIAGMGGSALAGLIIEPWVNLQLPVYIVRSYKLPNYANDHTLVIISSYSGNTEETISALEDAEKRNCQIVVLASGGKLAEIAKAKGYALLTIPGGLQPRMAVYYSLTAIIQIFIKFNLLSDSYIQEMSDAAHWLSECIKPWSPDVPTLHNYAKSLALELMGKSVVVYGGAITFPAAYKWKISFNENAKHLAWVNQFSEFNHNEMLGWTKQPVNKPYSVILLRSNLENSRILKRYEVTTRLLSGLMPEPHLVNLEGDSILKQLLWAVSLGDFVSIYLALLSNIDPTPVELIEKFKQQLE